MFLAFLVGFGDPGPLLSHVHDFHWVMGQYCSLAFRHAIDLVCEYSTNFSKSRKSKDTSASKVAST